MVAGVEFIVTVVIYDSLGDGSEGVLVVRGRVVVVVGWWW